MNPAPEDLLLSADQIHVLGAHRPVEALLLRAGRVDAIGSEEEVRAAAGPGVRVLSFPGGAITPGITDAHVHLTAWALARQRVELGATQTLDEGLDRIRAAAAAGAGWILGLGWDRNRWGGLPDRAALDSIVADRPVFLESHDIHAAWLNTEALRQCGITRESSAPEGGEIVRDPETGEPTGILLENAKQLAVPHIPQPSQAEIQAALLEAQSEAHRLGITGVHSVEPTGLADFRLMQERGELRLRVLQHIALFHLDSAIEVGLRSGFGGDWLRIGGVKMFLDGALGSRTAWMREPYENSENSGIQTLSESEFREVVRRAADAGIASTVHAIGDAATSLALDVLGEIPPPASLPHRIEHLQLCPPELWERAGRSGIIGSMQPVHLLSDIPAAEQHWGHARSRGAYAFAALQRAGMTLAFGSDVPVETCDPRAGLFAAVRRVGWEGVPEDEWYPEHRLSTEQALRGYTEGPAVAARELHRRGRLLPGHDGDLVVWDRDPLACTPDEIREMKCLLTVVGGQIVHAESEIAA